MPQPPATFSAVDGKHGREFFVAFNGRTRADVYDINPGPAGSDPGPFDSLAEETGLAAATSAAHGRDLWKLTVPPTPQIELSGPASTVAAGSRATVQADLQPAPRKREPSGTVTFYSGGSRIGTGRLAPDGSGGMSAAVTFIARRGTQPIVAVYPGDARYTLATSNTVPVTAT